ncbi:MAG: type II toxin-antitoxin system PemK/MazF family toxin [Alphaproteobacteria bacterium]|nr:type II toxin-antitoxin system PemK/MazF family toxin [Alphaproteobacteria bacterium]
MPRFSRWDVVTVPFPYAEGDGSKHRPAVVVSASELADRHGLYWLVMITSAGQGQWRDDIAIDDPKTIGLGVTCVIRPCKIATAEEDRIARKIGTLPTRLRNALQAVLKRYCP